MVSANNFRVPLVQRSTIQVSTAMNWEALRVSEHLSNDDVLTAWTHMFAALFEEACDNRGVDPVAFRQKISGMENVITKKLQLMKWVESQRLGHDVGYEGIGPRPTQTEREQHPDTKRMLADFSIDRDSDGIRRGVSMILSFPPLFTDDKPEKCILYFPDGEKQNLH